MRQGLVEYAVVSGVLLALAAGAIALYGNELRAALGVRPAPVVVRPAPAAPAAHAAARPVMATSGLGSRTRSNPHLKVNSGSGA